MGNLSKQNMDLDNLGLLDKSALALASPGVGNKWLDDIFILHKYGYKGENEVFWECQDRRMVATSRQLHFRVRKCRCTS